jgi:hypothetical protein
MDVNRGIVHAGFLSSTQAFSGSMTAANGTKLTWSVVGTDGTSVANNAVTTLGTAVAAKYAFKTVDSNNNVKNVSTQQTTQQQANTLNAQTQQAQIAADSATKQAAIAAGLAPKK